DIGNYFDRAEYIKWKSFRDTDDARYIGLVMPRVLGRLPYGPDTVPVRSFNYVEQVKGPDHEKYLWTSASFSFASNMVKSFINNGWCVQIRGPQAGGAVKDLPIHLYDLGTGNQVKIPSEVMIPETREFEFASLGFIPLSYYKNRDYACFFSANSAQKPALYDTADATANSRINARLPYIFLLSRIAHYLKLIQRENIGTTKDRRLLELELNTWVRSLVAQARILADYLRNQPDGWLSAHRLIKNLRHDTLRQLPPLLADGKTRIEPPKPDQRALLKRLYLQQSWRELMEEADSLLSRGANHLWLDVQWYLHQALLKSGQEHEAAIIQADLKGLLSRLTGLETLAFNDGTPFADEVTLNWIQQQVTDSGGGWQEDSAVTAATASGDNDILQLESEALTLADSDGPDVALSWLQNRPGITTARSRWLLRLLMARVAEQTGKNELALHLLGELDGCAAAITLTQWEPDLLFEVKARRLKLLRMKAGRNDTDKTRLNPEMEHLLAGLIAIDPARAAVLCA
ncbi:type VI secretion system contractile sheath large subunit, partial [Enterobacter hormaechei]|nr:type VI secretion system contractile sheath large subunit [Enterobacter hormaechei]